MTASASQRGWSRRAAWMTHREPALKAVRGNSREGDEVRYGYADIPRETVAAFVRERQPW